MTGLWDPWRLGALAVPNRVVRSATWEGMAGEDGEPSPALAETLRRVAAGGAGLVVAGFAFVDPRGRALPGQTGLHDDRLVPALSRVAAAIRAEGAASAVQIGHCGLQLWRQLAGRGGRAEGPGAAAGAEEMTVERIQEVVAAFAAAARRAREAGFDAVQLHAAHGYLLSSFLAPRWNRRTDAYGGDLAGRARLVVETVAAVRAAVGPSYPVFAKWNGSDHAAGGLEPADSLAAARLAAAAGLDALEVSGGVMDSGEEGITRGPRAPEGYFAAAAELFARELGAPVGTVGGIRTPAGAAALLARGLAFVSLARPLVREPDLPRRWREGSGERAACVSCDRCFLPGLRGRGLRCLGR